MVKPWAEEYLHAIILTVTKELHDV